MKQSKFDYELCLFYLSAFIGGIYGAYAVLRCNMFASAQTVNLITSLFNIMGSDFKGFMIRIVIMCAYALGISFGVIIPKYTKWNLKYVSVIATFITSLVLGFMPDNYVGELILLPVFFSMSIQWNAFPGAKGYQGTSIFLTNNFRQTVMGLTSYLCTKENHYKVQFKFYFLTILCYFIGCYLTYITVKYIGYRGILFTIIPLVIMSIIIFKENKVLRKQKENG